MIIYVTPKGGGDTMTCRTMAEVHDAMQLLNSMHGTTEFSIVRGDLVCDFCSSPDGVVSLYSANPERLLYREITPDMDVTHMDADGLWAACPDCDAILTRIRVANASQDIPGLRKAIADLHTRSVDYALDTNDGIPRFMVEQAVTMAHSFFFAGWNREPGMRIIQDSEILS